MTNSHDDLHKIVTQKEKDRTVTGTVTAQQTVPGDLKATVTQLEKDRTVTNAVAANLKAEVSGTVNIGEATVVQPDPADLKATVTQAAKDRTISGSVTVTQSTAAHLKSMVTQAEKDRTVTCDTPANLKSTVTQAEKDRTVTCDTFGNLKGTVLKAVRNQSNYPNDWDESKDYSEAQTNTEIKAAPTGGLSLYITDIMISNGATAGNITLLDGSGGSPIWELYPGVNGGCTSNLRVPIKLTADTALCITSTSVTTHSLTICGFKAA